jgi:MFS transporter, DHA2 family, multidrug resistance protein
MTPETAPLPSPADRWLISVTVMISTVMVVLDITIVNVALPHMMGSLGAGPEQITWVLTSYLVTSAAVMPLTGYLAGRLGRKRLLLGAIVGFVGASALCGISGSLTEIVLFRVLQGAFGAPLVPLSQSLMVDTFPPEERGRAMAIWGIGVMVGPIMGPTLGGYLTQHFEWRWIFYINVPVGIIALLLGSAVLRETVRRAARTDWTGLGLMATGIGALQVVLDRGNQENWFSSRLITVLALIAAAALGGFVLRGWGNSRNIVNLELFRDRNFAAASLMIGVFGLGLFGTIALQPMMLERLLGYPAETTGLVMAPRGLASAVSMMLVGRLITRRDPRKMVAFGALLGGLGTAVMGHYNLEISPGWVVWPSVIQGLGMGMLFVPLSTVAFETLPVETSAEAAGLFSLIRTIGGSIGISVVTTVLTRQGQVSWHNLGGDLDPFSPALRPWLAAHGLQLTDPLAPQLLAQELYRQSSMVAFTDVFWLVTFSFLASLPLIAFLQRPKHQRSPAQGRPAAQAG